MPYCILAFDFENMEEKRENFRPQHRSHLKSAGTKLLASGALLSEDSKTIIGGMSLLDTDDFSEAQLFADEDPYHKAGLRKQTLIIRWRKRWWDGSFLPNNL